MKKKDIEALHKNSAEKLASLIEKAEAELVKLGADLSAGRVKDAHQLKKKRRDLARMKTVLQEKKLEVA